MLKQSFAMKAKVGEECNDTFIPLDRMRESPNYSTRKGTHLGGRGHGSAYVDKRHIQCHYYERFGNFEKCRLK